MYNMQKNLCSTGECIIFNHVHVVGNEHVKYACNKMLT